MKILGWIFTGGVFVTGALCLKQIFNVIQLAFDEGIGDFNFLPMIGWGVATFFLVVLSRTFDDKER